MPVQLNITLNDNGSITINGPINNKILCYGILEAAGDVIRNFRPEEKPLIEVPSFVAPTDINSRR